MILSREGQRILNYATKIYAMTRHRMNGNDPSCCMIPVITFDELGLRFQDVICLDLRERGVLILYSDSGCKRKDKKENETIKEQPVQPDREKR